jgi:iron complex transport system permease protein
MLIKNSRHRLQRIWWIGLPLLLLMSIISIKFGIVNLSWIDFSNALLEPKSTEIHTTLLWDIRIPRTLTSMIASALLALSGLVMQSLFRNPLAGPSILGVTSGSSLGVALVTLAASAFGWQIEGAVQQGAIPFAAFIGAMGVLSVVLMVSKRMADHQSLLIFGVMLGYFTSALITTFQYKANADTIRTYVLWGMGSFSEVQHTTLVVLCIVLIATYWLIRREAMAMNCYLLGDAYATTMGHDIQSMRWRLIGICGLQVGLVTAFCGPIAFIGLTVPIITRIMLRTSDHRYNVSAVVIVGMLVGILSDQMSIWLSLPLNAITAALGAPMILWLLLKNRTSQLSL